MKSKYVQFVVLFNLIMAPVFAGDWQVDKSQPRMVKYISSTPLLDFEGVTEEIDGYLFWEGEELTTENNDLYFEIIPEFFDSGIGKRDRDMREDVLETDKYPIISFTAAISEIENISQSEQKVNAEGELYMHGAKNKKEIAVTISKEDELMHVTSRFNVLLADYNIEAPQLVSFIKVAQEIKIELDFYLKEANGEN